MLYVSHLINRQERSARLPEFGTARCYLAHRSHVRSRSESNQHGYVAASFHALGTSRNMAMEIPPSPQRRSLTKMESQRKSRVMFSIHQVIAWLSIFTAHRAYAVSFADDFHPYWGANNVRILDRGQTVQLSLDQKTGCGFATNNQYLYGYFSVQLKLVSGNSAGTLTSFYLSSKRVSTNDVHDEVDFEFLGNVSGQPYVLQTNVYTGGVGGREQRFHLWFDPSAAYHWYSILWNRDEILFWVDTVPIRSFKNNSDLGVPYPSTRPMALYSSIFDASQWATQGGRVGIDWSQAPFVSSYTGFTLMGCKVDNNVDYVDPSDQSCHFSMSTKWWEQEPMNSTMPNAMIVDSQRPHDQDISLFGWVRKRIMIYDYCTDSVRYPKPPPECSRNT